MPYIVSDVPGKKYCILTESLSPYPSDDTLSLLENEEIELVRITNEYSDKNIYKLFSRERSLKEFLENVRPEKTEKFIRPYIERRIKKCFLILRDEGTNCYAIRTHSNIIHPEDRLQISTETAFPVFRFERSTDIITYKLTVESEKEKIELLHNKTDILCNNPCLIRYGNKILMIRDIDGQKLLPFLTKEFVIIPKSTETRYFSGFVLNAVNNYNTEGKGFKVLYPEPVKKAILSLEGSILGYPVIIMTFDYSGIKISPDDKQEFYTVFHDDDGEFVYLKYRRDFGWENLCRDLLNESGFNSDDNVNFYLQDNDLRPVKDIHNVIEAVNKNYAFLASEGFQISSRHLDKKYYLGTISIELKSRTENDWFDLDAVIKTGEWQFPFIKFRNHVLKGQREFELPDGSTAILPEAWFTRYKNIFEFGKDHNNSIRIHKQHFPLLSEVLDTEKNESLKKLEKLLLPDNLPLPVKPKGLSCEMRDYQHEGLGWLKWLQSARLGGCLADDMGLGKTIQTLALLQMNKEENEESSVNLTSLIVVPSTIIYNWENEIRRFVPLMCLYTHRGPQRERNILNFNKYEIILSSYHTVRQDIDLFAIFKFHYIVLDESQYIKNPSSLIYKSMTRLQSDHRLVLTGTPIENSVTDLWAQLNFVNPGLLGNLSWFRRTFARPIEKETDNCSGIRLKMITRPFILRRTKEMVITDLPPLTEQTVFCEMTEEQEKIYETEKSAVRNLIMERMTDKEKDKSKATFIVLQGLMKLRQISNHPLLADEEYQGGSGKFETALNNIEDVVNGGHKILVFSSFVIHLKLFEEALRKKSINYSILTGVTTNRAKIINNFQNDPHNRVFLISLKAGGVGLNLTAADYVFILDPWWNPAAELQALSRAHRIGQDKSVFIYRYISLGTLEEKIIKLQEKKSKLAESFVATSNSLRDIDLQEILEIIG